MSKKKIINLISIALIIVIGAAASMISYSIATKGNGDQNLTENADGNLSKVGADDGGTVYLSNIDLIIQNANDKNETFNIVEIVPQGTAASGLKQYVSSGGFANYVITAHRTSSTGTMPADKIKYTLVTINKDSSPDNDEDLKSKLGEADLIYISSPSYDSYNGKFSTDMYNYLHVYAQGSNKPIIVDYVKEGDGTSSIDRSYSGLLNVIKDNYKKFRTYSWKEGMPAKYFFNASDGSYYLKYNVSSRTDKAPGSVLVISANLKYAVDASGNVVLDEYGNPTFLPTQTEAKDADGNVITDADGNPTYTDVAQPQEDSLYYRMINAYRDDYPINDTDSASTKATQIQNAKNALINAMYYGKTSLYPSELTYTIWNPNEVADGGDGPLTVDELNKNYDYIIIEDSVKDLITSEEVYNKIRSLSESSKYILFDSRATTSSGGSTTTSNTNNYIKLLNELVTSTGVERQSNILSITPRTSDTNDFFYNLDTLADKGIDSAKAIADLIDGSNYRGNDLSSNARKYRVLEIEPCYPVDLDIAKDNDVKTAANNDYTGGYYTKPDEVLYGVTKEEADGEEYYAFEISKAKIAHALNSTLGLNYNQVEVVQMSTNELISSKEVIAENYDFVYIGGDASALNEWDHVKYTGDMNSSKTLAEKLTGFNMYSHTGYWVPKNNFTYGNPTDDKYVTTLNGNDLTTIKLQELKDFINAGLPIVVDKAVTDAFQPIYDAEGNRLQQLSNRQIDPDSNMYKFLKYAYDQKQEEPDSTKNLMWGEYSSKSSSEQINNADKKWGRTTKVTVYKDGYETAIQRIVADSATRPSLRVVSAPLEYDWMNDSAVNESKDVGFTVMLKQLDATKDKNGNFISNYKVELYVDLDGDGLFDTGEIKDSEAGLDADDANTDINLGYTLDDNDFGLVSWLIKVTDTTTGIADVQQGAAFFKPNSNDRKQVKVLQIMPVDSSKYFTGNGAGHSLYMCTDCQQAGGILDYNVTIKGEDKYGAAAGLNSFNNDSTVAVNGTNVYRGKHQHNFGIVKFNNDTHFDDWNSNWADILLDDYDFDLDIVSAEDFDSYCKAADDRSGTYDTKAAKANLELYKDYYSKYQSNQKTAEILKAEDNLTSAIYDLVPIIEAAPSKNNNVAGYLKNDILNGIGTEESPGRWMELKQYYRVFEYLNDNRDQDVVKNGFNTDAKKATLAKAASTYETYAREYDKAVDALDKAHEYLRLVGRNKSAEDAGDTSEDEEDTGIDNNWLLNNYDIIILGFADEFAENDLEVYSCDQLKDYVNNGGMLLNTHDTTAKYKGKGAINLTDSLREMFGMDRFHVIGRGSSVPSDSARVIADMPSTSDYTLEIVKPKNTKFKIGSSGYSNKEFELEDGKDIVITYKSGQNQNQEWDAGGQDPYDIQYVENAEIDGRTKITVDVTDSPYFVDKGVTIQKYNSSSYNYSTVYTIKAAADSAGRIVGEYSAELDADVIQSFGTYTIGYKDIGIQIEQDGSVYKSNTQQSDLDTTDLLSATATVKVTLDNTTSETVRFSNGENSYTQNTTGVSGSNYTTFTIPKSTVKYTYDLNLSDKDITLEWKTGDAAPTKSEGAAVSGTKYNVTINTDADVDSDGVLKKPLTRFSYIFKNGTYDVTLTTDGDTATGSFELDTASAIERSDIASIITNSGTGVHYVEYATEDASKYFWTQRLLVSDDSQAAAKFSEVSGNFGINSPLGLTDLFAYPDTKSTAANRTPYRFVAVTQNMWDHVGTATDSDGSNFQAHYGTKRAQQVNKGYVVTYPFAIADTLNISPTHSQMFALDLEDPKLCVWYTLGGAPLYQGATTKVESSTAIEVSSLYAASPRDGMSNYFLYSKNYGDGKVFYTGAGHMVVTGVDKDNNDERKLFINIVVNSVAKGKVKPSLRLYNTTNDKDTTSEKEYVDPTDASANAKLSKKTDKLFYNKTIKMYQYNVEDSVEDIYPTFDFKVLKGTKALTDIKVFYDLDYGKDGDYSDVYDDSKNSTDVLITEYTKSSNPTAKSMDHVRINLNSSLKNLLLKDNYKNAYGDYTYIVINATDAANNFLSARIKVTLLPYLFDLTDATIDYHRCGFTTSRYIMDITDRKQFNI